MHPLGRRRFGEVDAQVLHHVQLNCELSTADRELHLARVWEEAVSTDVTGRAWILTESRCSCGVRTLLLPGGALVGLPFPVLGVNDESPVAVLRKE